MDELGFLAKHGRTDFILDALYWMHITRWSRLPLEKTNGEWRTHLPKGDGRYYTFKLAGDP